MVYRTLALLTALGVLAPGVASGSEDPPATEATTSCQARYDALVARQQEAESAFREAYAAAKTNEEQ